MFWRIGQAISVFFQRDIHNTTRGRCLGNLCFVPSADAFFPETGFPSRGFLWVSYRGSFNKNMLCCAQKPRVGGTD